ncbi:MAG TPA: tRNA-dihydrouridine synthase family protein [Planctomycetota bacterium]|nr:tRNA-dihydrouridine synthase family protein [Planctomycetota bacterium]
MPAPREHLPLPFTGPYLLAPMQGITEPVFRSLVLARNPPGILGGAFTEFVRVTNHPAARRQLRRHLGERRFTAPVGLQFMGSDPALVAVSASRAVEVGAPLIDLNFGCPAPGALASCSGAALLKDPRALERMVATCRAALPTTPLSAKIRAGFSDDSLLEDLARAADAGGADLLTVHCRTRAEGYRPTRAWDRIARAVSSVSIPVCGNGGVRTHDDLDRLRAATGCDFIMVGHGALADPWIFSGHRASTAQAARFLLDYASALAAEQAMGPTKAAARVKQLLAHWTAGGLVDGERQAWLRERDPRALLERLEGRLAEA